jgi:hypothetical protein
MRNLNDMGLVSPTIVPIAPLTMDFKDLHRYSQLTKNISALSDFPIFFINISFNFYYVTTSIFLSFS